MSAPVVLLHGMATNAFRTWVETGWVDLLTDEGRQATAFDLLGHGDAPQPTDPAAYDDFEQYALDRIGEASAAGGGGPVDAVGFSLGSRTLLALAAGHPDRFRRLVVSGVGENLFRRDGSSALLADALEREPAADELPIAGQFRRMAAASGQSLPALVALLRRPNPPVVDAESLAAVTHPTLVVLGDGDFAGPAAPLVEALPQARFVELRRTDHFATPKSMAFLDAALSFLSQ